MAEVKKPKITEFQKKIKNENQLTLAKEKELKKELEAEKAKT